MQKREEQFIHIDKYGNKLYFKNREMTFLHRLDGPAVEYVDGFKSWYVDGKRHRIDGPAVEGSDGSKEWYVDGRRHRIDGPAVEYVDGYKAWYVDGKFLTKKEFIALTAPKQVELTFDQIAEKFGISVEQLKVVK
jgi:hypothetical protein